MPLHLLVLCLNYFKQRHYIKMAEQRFGNDAEQTLDVDP